VLIVRRFVRDVPAVIGLVVVVAAVILAVIGPWVAPHPGDIVASHLFAASQAAEFSIPVRHRQSGPRSLVARNPRNEGALEIAVIVVVLASAIAVPLGLIAGNVSGWLSEGIMRITDVFLALPQLVLALVAGC
jgi:peptide/nickel transport system permease protein